MKSLLIFLLASVMGASQTQPMTAREFNEKWNELQKVESAYSQQCQDLSECSTLEESDWAYYEIVNEETNEVVEKKSLKIETENEDNSNKSIKNETHNPKDFRPWKDLEKNKDKSIKNDTNNGNKCKKPIKNETSEILPPTKRIDRKKNFERKPISYYESVVVYQDGSIKMMAYAQNGESLLQNELQQNIVDGK